MLNALIDTIAPLVRVILEKVLTTLFDTIVTKQPEHGKVVLASLYPVVDVELEGLADDTKNKIDDAVVDAVKKAMEDVAAKHGIILSNVDDD